MKYDVVLWGATGFTGSLVAEYLLEHAGEGVSWALAGRNRSKLEALRGHLAERDGRAADLPLILADAADPESLAALTAQAKVVCTTVGPYVKYGAPLVAACVEQGAHYCDLTGEPQFVRRMIEAHHDDAAAKGVRIVHCCGFDSIPSDLGCFVVQQRAQRTLGHPLPEVTTYVRKSRGGPSGGTVATALAIFDEIGDRATRRVLADPYSLLPEGTPRGPRTYDMGGVSWDEAEEVWTAPFLMASMNPKIVRRSNALLGLPWGKDFRYREVSSFPRGFRGWRRAMTVTAGMAGYGVLMGAAPLRRFVARQFLPAPGEGPDREARERGLFEFHVVGRDPDGTEIRVIVRGDKDPGYGSTAGMVSEAALCLALDPLPERFGILTPASAMGEALLARLPRAGVTFEVAEG